MKSRSYFYDLLFFYFSGRMKADMYQTIEIPSKGIFKDRGSKFLAFAYPVFSVSEIKEILQSLRKDYYDARHHCYAYILGADKKILRDSDDGEPTNTAGKPIMRQLQSNDLTNILIVVIRYFGGTLLGIGGLIKAYGNAASDALGNARIITKTEELPIAVEFNYSQNKSVQKIIKEEKLEIRNQKFGEACSFEVNVSKSDTGRLIERFRLIENVDARLLANDTNDNDD